MTSGTDPIADLVIRSGNNFHARVARAFRDRKWKVVVSPYYLDQVQGKAREIDLIAEATWRGAHSVGETPCDVTVRLFVECKCLPTTTVFWMAEKDHYKAKRLVCSGGAFGPDNHFTLEHHYLLHGQKVAKLFATSASKESEQEPIYRALNQVLSSMVAMRKSAVHASSSMDANRRRVVIQFPVVVCNTFANLHSVDFEVESHPVAVRSNFQLEVDYAFADKAGDSRNEYFLLDFVELDQLDGFLTAIERDVEIVREYGS
jgi:hypothetical protein